MTTLDIIVTVLGSLGGAGVIILALSKWLGEIWSDRIVTTHKKLVEVNAEIDLDLRKRRIEVYKEIWEATGLLPKWPRAEDVTYEKLKGLHEQLRDWYFTKGGMYTSENTHDNAYSSLQEEIQRVLENSKPGILNDDDYDNVRKKCSELRTALADDILSRRKPQKYS